jgi:hypothetical protein
LVAKQIAPEEQDVYRLAVFISLRAPEERKVLFGVNSYMPLLRSEMIKKPGAINILLLRSKESRKLKVTFCAPYTSTDRPQKSEIILGPSQYRER